jgi:hypothetical protein
VITKLLTSLILVTSALADDRPLAEFEIAHSEFGRFRIYHRDSLELADTTNGTKHKLTARDYPLSRDDGVFSPDSLRVLWSPDERLFALTVHHHRHSSGTFLFYVGTKGVAFIPTGLEDAAHIELSPQHWLTSRTLLLGTTKNFYNVLRVDTRKLQAHVQKLK